LAARAAWEELIGQSLLALLTQMLLDQKEEDATRRPLAAPVFGEHAPIGMGGHCLLQKLASLLTAKFANDPAN
jgi:hypothetical protein